jgi:hypothetical protein
VPLLSVFVSQTMRAVLPKERDEDLIAFTQPIEAGKVTPVIDRTYVFADAPDAFEYWHVNTSEGSSSSPRGDEIR